MTRDQAELDRRLKDVERVPDPPPSRPASEVERAREGVVKAGLGFRAEADAIRDALSRLDAAKGGAA